MCYRSFFGSRYDRFMHLLEKRYLGARRKRLLSGLRGAILEVGVGTGVNLSYYGQEVHLTGIEPSPTMLAQARRKLERRKDSDRFSLFPVGCGQDAMLNLVSEARFDHIVCTLVLCTIPDPQRALENYMTWLKPGGTLVILEHIRSHHRGKGRLQDLANPLWEKIGDGCQLNRPTDLLLEKSGFMLVREERFRIGLPFLEAVYRKPGPADSVALSS
ncbi:MAG: class I SAM-dependent methyltransferase [Bacteroidales bacterium]